MIKPLGTTFRDTQIADIAKKNTAKTCCITFYYSITDNYKTFINNMFGPMMC